MTSPADEMTLGRAALYVAVNPSTSRGRCLFAAGRAGDFDALVAVLRPDVVARSDFSPSHPSRSTLTRGATAVARQARMGASPAVEVHPALVNGTAGAVITMRGQPFAVMAFTVAENKIVEIDAIADPDRFATLAAPDLADPQLEPRVISQTVQAASG